MHDQVEEQGYFDTGGNHDQWKGFIFSLTDMYRKGMITNKEGLEIMTVIDCGDESSFNAWDRNKDIIPSKKGRTFGSIVATCRENGINEIEEVCTLPNDWKKELKTNQFGEPKANQANFEIILKNDPVLKNLIAWNEFTKKMECIGSSPWNRVALTQAWEDPDSQNLRVYIS